MIGGTWRYVLREIETSRIAAGARGAKCAARAERRMVTSGRCACYFRKPKKTHLNAVGGIGVPQSIFLSLAEEAGMRGTNWGKGGVGSSAMVCALLTRAGAMRARIAGCGDS